MEMTVGFPELGSRFEFVADGTGQESFHPDLKIKTTKTIKTKITVCRLEQINAPHELVLIYQEDFNPDSSYAEIEARAKEYASQAIAGIKSPGLAGA